MPICPARIGNWSDLTELFYTDFRYAAGSNIHNRRREIGNNRGLGDRSRRMCGDRRLCLLVRLHGFMEGYTLHFFRII